VSDEVPSVKKIVRKKTRGRPSIYDPANLEQVTKYALLGLIDDEIADLFNVSTDTFSRWKRDIPGFLIALSEGREKADANVASSLYERACGYSHEAVKIFMPAGAEAPVYAPYEEHIPADVAAARIWLYNRQRKRFNNVVDNQVNVTNNVDVNLSLTGISDLLTRNKNPDEAGGISTDT